MLNRNLLKSKMVGAGYTQELLARRIGISANTLSSRMLGTTLFNTEEIDLICDILNITDNDEKVNIFLSNPSQKREEITA